MLTQLRLGNFKAFGPTQTIPIKPITLIFGPNSAGKSSIIHSLLLAHQAAIVDGNLDVHQPRIAGPSVDLGGFLEYVHGHQPDRRCLFGFALKTDTAKPADMFAEFDRADLAFEIGLPTRTGANPVSTCGVGLLGFSLSLQGELLLRAVWDPEQSDGSLHLNQIEIDHPVLKPFFERALSHRTPESLDPGQHQPQTWEMPPGSQALELREPQAAIVRDMRDRVDSLGHKATNLANDIDREFREDPQGLLQARCEVDAKTIALVPGNLVPISARPNGARERFRRRCELGDPWGDLARKDNPHFLDIVADVFCFGIEDMLDWVNDELKRQLESLAYLGPLRSYPPRHLVGMQDREPNWFSGGGHAWDTLRRDPAVLDQVNRWLGNPDFASVGYELRLRNLTDLTRIGEGARRRLAYRVRQADTATEADVDVTVDALLDDLASDPAATALGEIRLLDRRTQTEVSHRDVGIGISQVVPVLVHAYANRNQTVLIEQPEIHLHPKLQADLGDVFIEAALAEAGPHHTFLIETHSEHLILRILRRVRESCAGNPCDPPPPDGKDPPKVEIRPEDVCVLYVLPKPTGAQVIELPVTEEGDFTANWPGGFFTDRARELF